MKHRFKLKPKKEWSPKDTKGIEWFNFFISIVDIILFVKLQFNFLGGLLCSLFAIILGFSIYWLSSHTVTEYVWVEK